MNHNALWEFSSKSENQKSLYSSVAKFCLMGKIKTPHHLMSKKHQFKYVIFKN